MASLPDDGALLALGEQILDHHWGAAAYDAEILRLHPIWVGELKRLADEVDAGRSTLTAAERYAEISKMPEAIECQRLQDLQGAQYEKMDALIKEMWRRQRTPRRAAAPRWYCLFVS